jgi:hydroxymethylbilane synthase
MHLSHESQAPSGADRLIIGSRGSDLALYQANLIGTLLGNLGVASEIKIIKTVGDKIDNLSFDKIEGKGFFTKELEDALLALEIDLAVHSLKDLSTQMPEGLKVGAYCNPEDPSELLLVRSGCKIGTSSVRRQAQIAYFRPDLKIEPLRGNVPTRIKKLREGNFDAILIARAGVLRLGQDLSGLRSFILDRFDFIPAPGQGILTLQIRESDPRVETAVSRLNESDAEQTARLERGLLARFQGGCQLPLAVTSEKRGNKFYLKAFLGNRNGVAWGYPSLFEAERETIEDLINLADKSLSAPTTATNHKKKVLITRSETEARRLFDKFPEMIEPVYYPVFTIAPSYADTEIVSALACLDGVDWLVFTSKNSVRIFFDILREYGATLPWKMKIAAVGRKTAEFIKMLGIAEVFVPEREDSAGLIDDLPRQFDKSQVSVLLPQGEEAPSLLENGLEAKGHKVVRLNIYRTLPTSIAHLPDINVNDIDFFIFTSALSATYFSQLGHDIPERAWIAAIGQPTAEVLNNLHRPPDFVPDKADLDSIVERILEQF